MKFRAHDTFFIRKGWLNKGLRNVNADAGVFMGSKGNPMDVLGIGANMVKALRYWLQAVRLTSEPASGRKEQTFTDFGNVVFENDPYIEEMGTLWLLHYQLASNKDEATAWYYFFNEFKASEFTKEDFVKQLSNYVRINGEEVSERSLEDDYNCIINTYVSRMKSNPEKVQPESNIDCPFGELGLIDIASRKEKLYRKATPKKDLIHPLVVLAIILDQANGKEEIKISSIQNDPCNVGKIFNLDIITLTALLYKIELIMKQLNISTDDRPVVSTALNISESTDAPVTAIELHDGRIIHGKASDLLSSTSAMLLNALKALANLDDEILLISPTVFEPIKALKIKMHERNTSLQLDEILIALSICATMNPLAKQALDAINGLKGCDVHATVVLSDTDKETLRKLGTNATYEPYKKNDNLYYN
jgi:hypothetical protein